MVRLITRKTWFCLNNSHDPWDERYIHLHEWLIFVGKYTSPMDLTGNSNVFETITSNEMWSSFIFNWTCGNKRQSSSIIEPNARMLFYLNRPTLLCWDWRPEQRWYRSLEETQGISNKKPTIHDWSIQAYYIYTSDYTRSPVAEVPRLSAEMSFCYFSKRREFFSHFRLTSSSCQDQVRLLVPHKSCRCYSHFCTAAKHSALTLCQAFCAMLQQRELEFFCIWTSSE